MSELIAVVALFAGVPMLITGWIWAIVAARKLGTGWTVAMVLLVPLPAFAMMHWHQAKVPFYVTAAGIILILITMMQLPES